MICPVTAPIHPLLEQINCIYQHPLHYTYILHKKDGFLHLYDQATMDIVGRTKVIVLEPMKLFAFTNDFNIFYGLKESKFLLFELSSTQWLAHMPVQQLQQNPQSKPYLEAYYLCYYSRRQILICVTSTNFYLVNPNLNASYKILAPLTYNDSIIYPQKVAEISGQVWIVGYRNYIYLLKFDQNFDEHQICSQIQVGNIVRLSVEHNPKREFVYVINDDNQVFLIKVSDRKIQICYKFYNENCIPHYLTLLRPGVNTSTTNKLKNRLYISIYCEEKLKKSNKYFRGENIFQEPQIMVEQSEESANKKFSLLIIPSEIQYVTLNTQKGPSSQFNLKLHGQTYVLSSMPELKCSPWINIFTQNCLLFLTTNNLVCYINFSDIKELNLTAQQWICMGYKFEELQRNQVYQQQENQFEDQSEKQQVTITKEFLDDWSQSNLPKNVVLNRAYNRIRAFDL